MLVATGAKTTHIHAGGITMTTMFQKLALAALLSLCALPGVADAASGSGSTSPSPPVPAGHYQGWYSRYIVTWVGDINTGSYTIQIQTTYVSGPTYASCATQLSDAMSRTRVYQWASCIQML
jgi:hypothetical protein